MRRNQIWCISFQQQASSLDTADDSGQVRVPLPGVKGQWGNAYLDVAEGLDPLAKLLQTIVETVQVDWPGRR